MCVVLPLRLAAKIFLEPQFSHAREKQQTVAVAFLKMSDAPPSETFFCMRIVNVDNYLAKPRPEFDIAYSNFTGTAINRVPIVRIFGATPAGQKACLHLHKTFPYFFLRADDEMLQTSVEQGN